MTTLAQPLETQIAERVDAFKETLLQGTWRFWELGQTLREYKDSGGTLSVTELSKQFTLGKSQLYNARRVYDHYPSQAEFSSVLEKRPTVSALVASTVDKASSEEAKEITLSDEIDAKREFCMKVINELRELYDKAGMLQSEEAQFELQAMEDEVSVEALEAAREVLRGTDRVKSEIALQIVRSLPCIIHDADNGPSEAHHWVTKGAGGSDLMAVPLCRICHNEIHTVGRDTFVKEHGGKELILERRLMISQILILTLENMLRNGGDKVRRG